LLTISEADHVRRSLVVRIEADPRRIRRFVEVMPWRLFLQQLWAGDLGA